MEAQGFSGFLYSPMWSQVSPTPWGFGLEQTGHAGMSDWGKSKVATRAGRGLRGPMLKLGSAELNLAGGKSILLCLMMPSPQLREMLPGRETWGLIV